MFNYSNVSALYYYQIEENEMSFDSFNDCLTGLDITMQEHFRKEEFLKSLNRTISFVISIKFCLVFCLLIFVNLNGHNLLSYLSKFWGLLYIC